MKRLTKSKKYFLSLSLANLIITPSYLLILKRIDLTESILTNLFIIFSPLLGYFLVLVIPFFLLFKIVRSLLRFIPKKYHLIFIMLTSLFTSVLSLLFISLIIGCFDYGYSLYDLLCCLHPEYLFVTLFAIINYPIFVKIFLSEGKTNNNT